MQLGDITFGRGATFKVRHIGPLGGNDQRTLKLARVLGVNAEICRQFHWAANAFRDVNERPIREHSAIQRCIVIVRRRHHCTHVFLDQLRVIFNRFTDRTKDHTSSSQLFLERGADRHTIKNSVHRDLAALSGHILRAFDTGQNGLLFQRDTQLFVSFKQLWVHIIQ